MTYPWVAAKWYTPNAIVEYRAIVIHMAEGGGTVGYLANVTRDVSASHVIEYSGRIVQMVRDGDASHCQHTSPEPYTTADSGTFSVSTGKAVLGDGWADVNRYVFAVEIEGFRAAGPNTAQKTALAALVTDLRARYPSIRGLLGHRDVQDKPCPGGLIPWAVLGGHGLLAQGGDMQISTIKGEDWTSTTSTTGASNGVLREQPVTSAPIVARIAAGTPVRSIAEIKTTAAADDNWRLTEHLGRPMYMLRRDWNPLAEGGDPAVDAQLTDYIARKPLPAPVVCPPPIDCTPLVNAARAEGATAGLRDGARAVKDAAVNEALLYGG